jgi:hypothetical protein
LFLVGRDGLHTSAGSEFARLCAEVVFMKPWFVADTSALGGVATFCEWFERVKAAAGAVPLVLAIGGPRESESPGIYEAAAKYLAAFFAAVAPPSPASR